MTYQRVVYAISVIWQQGGHRSGRQIDGTVAVLLLQETILTLDFDSFHAVNLKYAKFVTGSIYHIRMDPSVPVIS